MEFTPGVDKLFATFRETAYPIKVWDGCSMPIQGNIISIDTETTSFDETGNGAELVLLQAFNGRQVELVGWDLTELYLKNLEATNPNYTAVFFNAGYDINILYDYGILSKLDKGEVKDVNMNYIIHSMADVGYFYEHSLSSLVKYFFNFILPKPKDVRLGFSRDKVITHEDAVYGSLDAIATYELFRVFGNQPTDYIQAWGDITLQQISRNGLRQDLDYTRKKEAELKESFLKCKEKLFQMGFDPDVVKKSKTDLYNESLVKLGIEPVAKIPGTLFLKHMIMHTILLAITERSNVEFTKSVKEQYDKLVNTKSFASKAMKTTLKGFFDGLCMPELYDSKKSDAFIELLSSVLEWKFVKGLHGEDMVRSILLLYDENAGWTMDIPKIKPAMFLQNYFRDFEKKHSRLLTGADSLPRTDATRDKAPEEQTIQVSGSNRWIWEQFCIKDDFVNAYVDYKHTEKMISTYCTDKYVKFDGRVHPRFVPFNRTGRTGCRAPNIQNIPKKGGFREMYIPEPGEALVSIDYNQLELCALAQHCYTVYGFSRMRELINAGVDLHGFFGAVMLGRISPNIVIDEDNMQFVKEQANWVKANEGTFRGLAKVLNFGAPGGMQHETLFCQSREWGIYKPDPVNPTPTRDDFKNYLEMWFNTFPEMGEFMKVEQYLTEKGEIAYKSQTILGRVRAGCGKNKALNMRFQGLAATGAKKSIYALYRNGFKNNMRNFIHDEIIFSFALDSAHELTLKAADIMVRTMSEVIPDVKIKVDYEVMTRWSKDAKLVLDENKRIIPDQINV